jgi:DNA primase
VIPDSFKQDLLNRVDIVEVVSRYVQLKKAGANHLGLCPFHNEKSPSFTVSAAKQFYHCFGCGEHGNAIGFLMAYGGMGYIDALKDLASGVGMQVPEWQPRTPEEAKRKEQETDLQPVMEKAMEFYRAELKKSPRAIDYLKGRGLTGEIAARFRIGYAPDDWQGLKAAFPDYEHKSLVEAGLVVVNENKRYDRFRDRIMFPIFSARGVVIGFGGRVLKADDTPKYMNSPETPLFEKGREIYGLVQARDAMHAAGRILVVEGYMDVVALAQFGVGYAVATLGTATTPVHVSKLQRLTDELVFSFDGDAAGRKAAWRALEVSLPLATDAKPVKFLFLPDGEDPDTYIRKHGKDAFEALVRGASTLSEFFLAEMRASADLSSAEGRSKYLVTVKPHLQKLAAPTLRLQVIKQIADLVGMSQPEVEQALDIRSRAPSYARPAPPKTAAPMTGSQERNLLRCVLAKPELAAELEDGLLDPGLPETGALRAIAESPGASSALLVERFQGTEFEQIVIQTMASDLTQELTGDAADAEFRQIQLALRIRRKHKEIEALRQRAEKDPKAGPELALRLQELGALNSQRTSPSA